MPNPGHVLVTRHAQWEIHRLNTRPPAKPVTPEPFKHVIDEYKHRDQTITCTCGWHGSSAQIDRGPSEWTAHLIEVRGKKR
jgi:hypothetical protein